MKTVLIIFCSLSICFSTVAMDSNQSAALVNPNEQSDWQQAQQALTAVLSKKSGLSDTNISAKYSIDESFKSAIIRSYHEQIPGQFAPDKQWFNVVVDNDKIQQLMLSQSIPVWPDRRGTVYVWMVEENLDQPLAHANTDSEAVYWLQQWFDILGLPSQFYNAETEDLLAFKPEDVRYLNPDLIDYIHSENEITMTLMVFVKHNSNGYSYRFGLTEPEKPSVIKNLKFLDLASGMKSLAANVQAIMANKQRLSADEFNTNTVAVTVNDISDANHVLRLLNYLDQHALIEEYQVNQLKSRQLNLMMRIKVLPQTFIKFVENDGLLVHQPLDLGRSLLFKWVQ